MCQALSDTKVGMIRENINPSVVVASPYPTLHQVLHCT